jgi:sugar lactone lactonase YvrE
MDGLTIPNGPAFNAVGDVMYVADTALGTITPSTSMSTLAR